MQVRFWGVRGSCAVSGDRYLATGGNTSCVEVLHEGERLILDGGTGLRALGEQLGCAPVEATLLLSHLHWDHIQGIPFFLPAYHPESQISLVGVDQGSEGLQHVLQAQMQAPAFPVGFEILSGVRQVSQIRAGAPFQLGTFTISPVKQPHPNGCAAFRIEAGGQSLVYATDVEHGPSTLDRRLLDLAQDTDLLIHDAQYSPEEYDGTVGPPKKGWGHSTYSQAAQVARRAGATRLALFHHDPGRDDEGVASLEAACQAEFAGAFAAREGEVVCL